MNCVLRHYVSDVRRALCCPGRMKRQILRELRDHLEDYCSDGGEMTRQAVEAEFGAAEAYALGYVQTMTDDERNEALRRAKIVRMVTAIACGLIIAAVLAFAIVFTVLTYQSRQTHYSEQVFETSYYIEPIRRISL